MTPKLPACCSKCDAKLRDVKVRDDDGRPRRWGKAHPGTKLATLVHVDGSFSEHSLCASCHLAPSDLRLLWERAVLLYNEGIGEDDKDNPCHFAYARNLPIGVLSEVPL